MKNTGILKLGPYRLLALVGVAILLPACSDNSKEPDQGLITVSDVQRDNLHFWRVRPLSSSGAGPWSELSFFTMPENATDAVQARNSSINNSDLESMMYRAATLADQFSASMSAPEITLPQISVSSENVFEGVILPTPAWNAIEEAVGYEVEVVDVESELRLAKAIFDDSTVCGDTGCSATLVELNDGDNQLPTASIQQLEIDPLQAAIRAFSAEDSYDSDGLITQYRWRIDGRYIGDQTGKTFSYNFSELGSYNVGLEVTDDAGAVALTYAYVEIDRLSAEPLIDDNIAGIVTQGGSELASNREDSDDANTSIPLFQDQPGQIAISSTDAATGVVDSTLLLKRSNNVVASASDAFSTKATTSWHLDGMANAVLAIILP